MSASCRSADSRARRSASGRAASKSLRAASKSFELDRQRLKWRVSVGLGPSARVRDQFARPGKIAQLPKHVGQIAGRDDSGIRAEDNACVTIAFGIVHCNRRLRARPRRHEVAL